MSTFVWLSVLGRGGPAEALVLGSPMLVLSGGQFELTDEPVLDQVSRLSPTR